MSNKIIIEMLDALHFIYLSDLIETSGDNESTCKISVFNNILFLMYSAGEFPHNVYWYMMLTFYMFNLTSADKLSQYPDHC